MLHSESWPRRAVGKLLSGSSGISIMPVMFAVLCLVFTIGEPRFATFDNFQNIILQAPSLAILAFGQAFAILTGGIDLSVGAATGLISVAAAYSALDLGGWVGLVVGIAAGAGLGLVNGVMIAYFRIPPFIQTLGMLSFAKGLALWWTGAVPVQDLPPSFEYIGTAFWGPIPVSAVVAFLAFLLGWFLLEQTRFGRHIYAIGGNVEAARASGIDVRRVQLLAYMTTGAFAGLSAVVLSARINTGVPTLGEGGELAAIAAAVIGGVSLRGGIGRLGGVVLGALFLTVIGNGLNLANVSTYIQMMLTGCVIVLAVYSDLIRGKKY